MLSIVEIKRIANDVGFQACGVSSVERLANLENFYTQWLSNGNHATMKYMARNLELRLNPAALVAGAKSVISVLLSYNTGDMPLNTKIPRIARYATRVDYHVLMKKRLWKMLEIIRERYPDVKGRAFVDSAPVMEREWAQRAGLGWIGKNSCLINRDLGSFVFIGELIVDIDIEISEVDERNRCGSCTRCIDACPTRAIVSPGVIDARKCISYLTIEKKDKLNQDETSRLQGWCFGCDICQEVCPWNKKAKLVEDGEQLLEHLLSLDSSRLAEMNEEEFNEWFGLTPVPRAGYERVKMLASLLTDRK